mgnify:FL=1
MKKIVSLLLAGALTLSLAACGGDTTSDVSGASGANVSGSSETNTPSGSEPPDDNANSNQEVTVPNNGEWDEILCSGDGYHLVKKEVDAYDGYKFTLGVVDDDGEWVQELTDTGTFVEEVRFRAEGSSETLRDSSCYMYLGEGVFLASPGVSVYTKDEEYRVGPWPDMITDSVTGQLDVAVWECLIWNVVDNSQAKFDASKISTFQDGYSLFCESEDAFGGGRLNALNTKGEITEFTCEFVPNKPGHNFPVYSEELFYACTDKAASPGFYDIEGNMVIDLSSYNMGRIPYSSEMGVNAPYFENGQATILFANNAGSVFEAVIDKTGAFVGEPEKVDVSVY